MTKKSSSIISKSALSIMAAATSVSSASSSLDLINTPEAEGKINLISTNQIDSIMEKSNLDQGNRPKGFFLNGGLESKLLAQEFLADPEKFLSIRGLTFKDIVCPDEAHSAKARADVLEREIALSLANAKLDEATLKKVTAIVLEHLGEGYESYVMPFGLKFLEKVKDLGGGLTATASVTVTFADTDGDVDG